MEEKCVYSDVCYKMSEGCDKDCLRWSEMRYLLKQSRVPSVSLMTKKLVPFKVDLESFRRLNTIKHGIESFVEEGRNLYIYSTNYGNGKTSWASKLLGAYFSKVWAGNGFVPRGAFVHVPTFLRKNLEVIGHPDQDFEDFKEVIRTCDLVVWDDIGSTYITDYDYKSMLSEVDNRILHKRSNIFTGNLDGDQFRKSLGDRLYSKIFRESECIEFKGPDRRGENL